jgi:hypothetical protein
MSQHQDGAGGKPSAENCIHHHGYVIIGGLTAYVDSTYGVNHDEADIVFRYDTGDDLVDFGALKVLMGAIELAGSHNVEARGIVALPPRIQHVIRHIYRDQKDVSLARRHVEERLSAHDSVPDGPEGGGLTAARGAVEDDLPTFGNDGVDEVFRFWQGIYIGRPSSRRYIVYRWF